MDLEKLPDNTYIARYSNGQRELFRTDGKRWYGSGPVWNLEELYNSDFMVIAMRNRPPIDPEADDKLKTMYALGYFVVPRVVQ